MCIGRISQKCINLYVYSHIYNFPYIPSLSLRSSLPPPPACSLCCLPCPFRPLSGSPAAFCMRMT